jgi:GNAT superfamily N-acetyltransferase
VAVSIAKTDSDINACFPVLKVLRPDLEVETFLTRVRRQEAQGYIMAYLREKDRVTTVAGFRVQECLAQGRFLYLDDLVTDPAFEGRGYGNAMMDWLIERARQEGCSELHLDSGHQRHVAHRLYLNKGMKIAGHHFSLKL